MKKLIVVLFVLFIFAGTACGEEFKQILSDYSDLDRLDAFAKEHGSEFSVSNILDLLSAQEFPEWKDLLRLALDKLSESLRLTGEKLGSMLFPAFMLALSGALLPENSGAGSFICRIYLCSGCVSLFTSVLNAAGECLRTTASFSEAVSPVLAAVLTASGKTGVSALISPSAALAGSLVEKFYLQYGLPLCTVTGCIALAANLSNGTNLSRLTGILKKLFSWSTGLTVTLFTAIIFLRGSAASVSDNLALRTAKYAVDSASPVIGSGVSDAWDTYLAGLSAARNGIGVSGAALLLSVCLKPMLTMAAAMFCLSLFSSAFELFGEKLAARSFDQLSGACRMALVLCGSAMAVWIILMGAALSLGRGIA